MKVAVMSDSHDHVWNMQKAIKSITDHEISLIIHLGDLVSSFMLDELEEFTGTMHLVFGNNPGDQYLLLKKVGAMNGKVVHHGHLGELTIEGKKIAFVHDPHYAYALAKTGKYDICLFGHTHRWHKEMVGDTLLLNPGEILGKKEPPGWAMLDLKEGGIRRVAL